LPAAAGAAVVGVTGAAVVLVVVAVLVAGAAVVGVVEPATVVVVAEGAAVVVVDELFLDEEWCVVVVVLPDALFEGELDPQAAATSPPARTMVPMIQRVPDLLDAVSVPSIRLNTYCSSPRCGARCRQDQGGRDPFAGAFLTRQPERHSTARQTSGVVGMNP
jgi:hypothetical protein